MQAVYEPKGRAREYAPLALNLYRGCSHGCTYCYAPSATRRDRETFAQAVPRAEIVREADKQLARSPIPGTPPVLLCFTCDPYQPCDTTHRLTADAIDTLHRHGHGVHILTKGGLNACRDFKARVGSLPSLQTRSCLGDHHDDAFACTLTFVDQAQSLEWEPLAAKPYQRLQALQEAHQRGITTWASLEPVINPEQSLELMRMAAPFVDLFKVGRWNHDLRAKEIDWRGFALRTIELMESLGKAYYLKDDLRAALAA